MHAVFAGAAARGAQEVPGKHLPRTGLPHVRQGLHNRPVQGDELKETAPVAHPEKQPGRRRPHPGDVQVRGRHPPGSAHAAAHQSHGQNLAGQGRRLQNEALPSYDHAGSGRNDRGGGALAHEIAHSDDLRRGCSGRAQKRHHLALPQGVQQGPAQLRDRDRQLPALVRRLLRGDLNPGHRRPPPRQHYAHADRTSFPHRFRPFPGQFQVEVGH